MVLPRNPIRRFHFRPGATHVNIKKDDVRVLVDMQEQPPDHRNEYVSACARFRANF